MINDGPAFYDDAAIFDTYMAKRNHTDNANDTLEKPVILELAGDLTNRRILDLGCGDATFGREALNKGCETYVGIDGSLNMVAAAQQNLAGTIGKVLLANIEEWDYPSNAFDLVVSRLAFHYIKDIEAVFNQIHEAIIPGGRLLFSVEHPVITSCDRAWQGNGLRQEWTVDNYFNTGQRITSWMGGQVVKYHRTIEDYFVGLQRAGFVVETIREATPQRERFEQEAAFQRRQRIPLFLIMAGHKS